MASLRDQELQYIHEGKEAGKIHSASKSTTKNCFSTPSPLYIKMTPRCKLNSTVQCGHRKAKVYRSSEEGAGAYSALQVADRMQKNRRPARKRNPVPAASP